VKTGARGWAAAGVWAVVIVVFGVVPTQRLVEAAAPDHQVASTLGGHFVEYAVLAALIAVAAKDRFGRKRGAALALTLAASLGVAIEVVQAFLPYRDCQAVDVLVNMVAAAFGVALFSAFSTFWGRRRSRRA
jgi:VanZ family protein